MTENYVASSAAHTPAIAANALCTLSLGATSARTEYDGVDFLIRLMIEESLAAGVTPIEAKIGDGDRIGAAEGDRLAHAVNAAASAHWASSQTLHVSIGQRGIEPIMRTFFARRACGAVAERRFVPAPRG
jgi:hypothetical protein